MQNTPELIFWLLLHATPGIGPVSFKRLLDRFGTARVVVEDSDSASLIAVRGMTSEVANAVLAAKKRLDWAKKTADALQHKGVRLVRSCDAGYPLALNDLPTPPPLLYMIGEVAAADRNSVSIVGTTKPSTRGRPIAEEFSRRLAQAGVTVVSGYAHGIDAAAHRGAFKGKGRSILCVPYGIHNFKSRPDFPPLPEIARRGAVVSECPPDEEWNARAAVARDRIIASLGRATFVIETRPHGGTLHTVRAAEQLRRPIFALTYRKPPESARGNSILIARGAIPVSTFGNIQEIVAKVTS